MMPAIYGNWYQIQQGPGFVTITYEMVHDTRVIPVDNRPHVSSKIRQYVGDARGRWDGNTLVVETTNFNDKVPYRGSSDQLRIVERFTPIGPDTLEWAITFDDAHTWAKPWTFAMNLTHDESQPPFDTPVTRATTGSATSSRRPGPKSACRQSQSSSSGRDKRDQVVITVDDDGPGVAADMRETVLLRGVRADQKAAGSGLGLAIVRDLAELYDGSISLGEWPLGGLRA